MTVFKQANPSWCNILPVSLHLIRILASLIFNFKGLTQDARTSGINFNSLCKSLKLFSLCKQIFCLLTWLDTDTKTHHLLVLQKAKYSFPLSSPIIVFTTTRVHSRKHLKETAYTQKKQLTCCLILLSQMSGECLCKREKKCWWHYIVKNKGEWKKLWMSLGLNSLTFFSDMWTCIEKSANLQLS